MLPEDDARRDAVILTDDDARQSVGYRGPVTPPGWIRQWWFELLAALAAVAATLEIVLSPSTYSGYDRGNKAVTVVLVVAGLACLAARRWFPFASPIGCLAVFLVLILVQPVAVPAYFSPFAILLVATAVLGAQDERRRGVAGAVAVIALIGLGIARDPTSGGSDFFFVGFFFALAWAAGFFVRSRTNEARQARAEARRLEADRAQAAEQAIFTERQRIARELHDVIAHSVSVMTVQAGAVRRLLLPEQEKEREALLSVEATGRQALTEMRRLVGLLKEDTVMPMYAPQPSLKTLDTLVGTVREAGLPVELTVEGELRELAPGVDLAAYRVVQEALTNALKYAGPARAWVAVRWAPDQLELEVENDGEGDADGQAGGGHGLVGMKERIAVVGGTLESGPRNGGGFVVRARIPIGGTS
jgi:signal transduction histidine kinase